MRKTNKQIIFVSWFFPTDKEEVRVYMSGTPIGSRISAVCWSKIRIKPGEICYFGTMKGLNFDKRFQASWVSSTASWESSTDCPTLFAKNGENVWWNQEKCLSLHRQNF